MALANGGYLHCEVIKKFLKILLRKRPKKKKNWLLPSQIQVSDPGPSWSSCFPKPQTNFLTCLRKGERQKKVTLNRISNSQPPGHESNTLATEPPGRDRAWFKWYKREK